MKVTVLQENLARGLGIVSRAVSPRSTLPVLSNILIASDEGRLRLSATNLELGITCWIGAKVTREHEALAGEILSWGERTQVRVSVKIKNRRLASPFCMGRHFEGAMCAPAFLSTSLAHLCHCPQP